ncbi:MAG: PUA domain-containing protein [Candidatus Bathyarchaeia archaeon]
MTPLKVVALKRKEAEKVLQEFSEKFGEKVYGRRFESVDLNGRTVYVVDGSPLILRVGEDLLPTLINIDVLNSLPKVVVDMGAVKYICNGADVMMPGVRELASPLGMGVPVTIVDEKYRKHIAVGVTLTAIRALGGKGKVVRNLHYVGDKIWRWIKASNLHDKI